MKKISIISIITVSLLTLNLYANQVNNYNVTIYKDKFLISDTNTIGNRLDTRINNGVEVDIIRAENINPSAPVNTIPSRPTIDDSQCSSKSYGQVCKLTLSSTDAEDGRISTFRVTDTNSNISNLTLVGNLITFTIPRKDSVINLSIKRRDSKNRSSNPSIYTFTSLDVPNTIPNRPVIDDSQCSVKGEGRVCKLTLSSIDTEDGRVSNFSATDTNSNISNLVLSGNNITFTIPRKDSVINLSITRLDSKSRSSNATIYTFTALIDPVTRFKNTLNLKCGIRLRTVNRNFYPITGTYTGDIDCRNKGLTNRDLDTFIVLKRVTGYLYLNGSNNFTNTNGLNNLSYVNRLFKMNYVTSLTSITLNSFTKSLNQLWFNNNPNLTSVSLPLLQTVYNNLELNFNKLTSVSFPSLVSIGGSLTLDNNPLTTISFKDNRIIKDFKCSYTNIQNINFVSNVNKSMMGGYRYNFNFNTSLNDIGGIAGKSVAWLSIYSSPNVKILSPLNTAIFEGYPAQIGYFQYNLIPDIRMLRTADFCNDSNDVDIISGNSNITSSTKRHAIYGVCY